MAMSQVMTGPTENGKHSGWHDNQFHLAQLVGGIPTLMNILPANSDGR